LQAGISFVIIPQHKSQLTTVWCQERRTHDGKVTNSLSISSDKLIANKLRTKWHYRINAKSSIKRITF